MTLGVIDVRFGFDVAGLWRSVVMVRPLGL
jgi:hypothetical protein